MSRPRAARALPRSRLWTWLWVGCATAVGFTAGLLLGAGDGWMAIACASVAGGVTYGVRRPRHLAWLGRLLFDDLWGRDDQEWESMRRRAVFRRRVAAARAVDAAAAPGTPGTPVRRSAGRPRWRRKYPPDGDDSPPFIGWS